jgi:hypothetical protein
MYGYKKSYDTEGYHSFQNQYFRMSDFVCATQNSKLKTQNPTLKT